MQRDFCPSTLVPRGLIVDEAVLDGSGAQITVRSMTKASVCPGCGTPSDVRPHSSLGYLTPVAFAKEAARAVPHDTAGRDAAVSRAYAPRPAVSPPRLG